MKGCCGKREIEISGNVLGVLIMRERVRWRDGGGEGEVERERERERERDREHSHSSERNAGERSK